jgi:hypothetical protein
LVYNFQQDCICPPASIGFFGESTRNFCGKEIRAIHPTNGCELEAVFRCFHPLKPAVLGERRNCSNVWQVLNKIPKICDLAPMTSRCDFLKCCDDFITYRGCYSERKEENSKARSRLLLNSNYDRERKEWFNDCTVYVKTNFPNAPYNGTTGQHGFEHP